MWRPAQAFATALVIIALAAPSAHARPIDCEQHCEGVRGKAKRVKCRRHCERRCRKPAREACYTGGHGTLSCCARGAECCGEDSCCNADQSCCKDSCCNADESCCTVEFGTATKYVCCSNAPSQACCATPSGDPYCADLDSDPANCRACGQACAANESCCGASCVDLTSDPRNCGTCANGCGYRESCIDGRCRPPLCPPYTHPCYPKDHPDSGAHTCCIVACCDDGSCGWPAGSGLGPQCPETASP